MPKAWHGGGDRSVPRSFAPRAWLSTARWLTRSAPLAGRILSAKYAEGRQAAESTVARFDERLENPPRADNQSEPTASIDSPAAPRNIARKVGSSRKADWDSCDRVVLFLPTPVTEGDLLREKLYHSTIARQRQRRRGRRWITENAGSIVFVSALLVLAWLLSAR